MTDLNHVADVLEKVALYLDATEAEKVAAVQADRVKVAEMLRDRIETLTGDAVDEDTLQKLASADLDILSTLDRLAEATGGDLGGPSDRRDSSEPLTKKEAAEAADESFLSWVLSEDDE